MQNIKRVNSGIINTNKDEYNAAKIRKNNIIKRQIQTMENIGMLTRIATLENEIKALKKIIQELQGNIIKNE